MERPLGAVSAWPCSAPCGPRTVSGRVSTRRRSRTGATLRTSSGAANSRPDLAIVDAAKLEGQGSALEYANAEADFAAAWLDQSINPASRDESSDEAAMNGPAKLVLNVRFTGDLERHEAEIRDLWGGPLCITEGARTIQELLDVQQELGEELDALGSNVDWTIPALFVDVVVAEESLQTALDERFGEGTVIVTGALRPVR